MADPAVQAQGLSSSQLTEEAGRVVMPGPAVVYHDRPVAAGYPARRPGSDATAVLTVVGLADDIDRLSTAWILQTEALPPGWEGF
jgi:hypothetical protein